VPILLSVAALGALAVACGSASSSGSAGATGDREPRTIRLHPGHYAFPIGGRLHAGDRIVCVMRAGAAAGGASVPKPGRGVSSSTGVTVAVLMTGTVRVICPAHPGNV
jgi:hypothetical protein